MTLRNIILTGALAGAAFALGASLFSSSLPQEPQAPTLTEHHKLLAKDAGHWKADCTMLGPDGGEQKFMGEEQNTLTCNGFWMQSKFTADFDGMPFEGFGLTGYDSQAKKYKMIWVDSMSDYLNQGDGTLIEDGKGIEFMMHGRNQETGKPQVSKNVMTYEGKDHRTFTMYNQMDGGEWVKTFWIDYTRMSK